MNRLYKSNKDKVFEGVCGGLGEYLNIDPVIIRLMWVVLVIFGGTGIMAYLIAMLIIPSKPETSQDEVEESAVSTETYSNRFWGLILLVAGFLLLLGVIGPVAGLFAGLTLFMGHILWPVLLIGLGLYLYFDQNGGAEANSSLSGIFPPDKKLYKSKSDRKIAGVCGGIGQYFNIDSNIIRVLWAIATLGSFGLGVIAYAGLSVYLQESE